MVFYPILFFSFSIIDWLTYSREIKGMTSIRTFGGKILRVYCWKKSICQVRQDRLSNHPNSIFSLYFALLFHGHSKRLCPDPIVGFGARLLASRLKKVICKLLTQDQTEYVPWRYISESVKLISDILEYGDKENCEGYMFAADIEKAFDTLDHNFILAV